MVRKLKELLFQNRSTKQTIVKNAFWLSFGQVASRLIRAGTIILAARLLGTTGYGTFSYTMGLAGFFTAFSDLGISNILTREAAQKPEHADAYFSTSFWIKLFLVIVSAIAIVIFAPHASKIEEAKKLLPLIALLIVFDNIREFCNAFFRAKEKMEHEALVTIFTNITITLFGFVILYLMPTTFSLTVSYVVSAGVGMCMAIIMLRKEFKKIISTFDMDLVKPILITAWPLAVWGLLGPLMLNVDVILLGYLRSASEIGLYAAGQKIVQTLYTLPGIVAASTFPTLSRLHGQQDETRIKTITEKTLATIFFAAVPIVIGGIILANPLLVFVYGDQYHNATHTFQILIITILFTFPSTLLNNLIFIHDKQKKLTLFATIAALANIILNVALVPSLGIKGAAIATLFVQAIYGLLMLRLARSLSAFTILPHVKRIVVAAFVMGVATFLLNALGLQVLLTIILSALFYIGTLLVLKEPILEEVKIMLWATRQL